jgi:predicted CXXCH cytochrome family protein
MNRLTALFFIAGFFLIMSGSEVVSGQHENKDISCIHCHSKEVAELQKSVHFTENISCTECHGGEINVSGTTISVNVMSINFTGVPARTNISDLCSKCHPEETRLYKESIHWKELEKGHSIAPTCTDCHGAHDILSSKNPESVIYSTNVPQLCSSCHQNQTKMSAWYYGIQTDRFDTYKKSFHYKALISGGTGVATCPDCHESHDVRNETDPASSIYAANLPATCGKPGCHSGQNALIYGGKVHEGASVYLFSIDAKKLVTYFYILMILFELAFTLGLISLDITSKFEIRRRE